MYIKQLFSSRLSPPLGKVIYSISLGIDFMRGRFASNPLSFSLEFFTTTKYSRKSKF